MFLYFAGIMKDTQLLFFWVYLGDTFGRGLNWSFVGIIIRVRESKLFIASRGTQNQKLCSDFEKQRHAWKSLEKLIANGFCLFYQSKAKKSPRWNFGWLHHYLNKSKTWSCTSLNHLFSTNTSLAIIGILNIFSV